MLDEACTALRQANAAICSEGDARGSKMGTTAVVLVIRDERGVTHVAETPPDGGTVFQVVRALD